MFFNMNKYSLNGGTTVEQAKEKFADMLDSAKSSPSSAAILLNWTIFIIQSDPYWYNFLPPVTLNQVASRVSSYEKGQKAYDFWKKWSTIQRALGPLPASVRGKIIDSLSTINIEQQNYVASQEAEAAGKKQQEAIAAAKAEGLKEADAAKAAAEAAKKEAAEAKAALAAAANDAPSAVKVRATTSATVKDKASSGKDSKTLGKLATGETVAVSTKNTGGDWTRIMYKGAGGFVQSKYIKEVQEKTTADGKTKVVTETKTVETKSKPAKKPSGGGGGGGGVVMTTAPTATTPPPEEGVSTGAKVGIGVGAAAVIGVALFFILRKK